MAAMAAIANAHVAGAGWGAAAMVAAEDRTTDGQAVVLIGAARKEAHTVKHGWRQLFRRLRTQFKPGVLDGPARADVLRGAAVVAFGAPRERLDPDEIAALQRFVAQDGGGLLLCAGEGGDARAGSNLNELLEALGAGVTVNADSVVRTVYHKYPHPKEVLVSDGVLNREIAKVRGERTSARACVRASECDGAARVPSRTRVCARARTAREIARSLTAACPTPAHARS